MGVDEMGKCQCCGNDQEISDEGMDEIIIMLMMHFPKVRGLSFKNESQVVQVFEALTCLDCEDMRSGVCRGDGLRGWEVCGCMEMKTKSSEGGTFGELPLLKNTVGN